MCIGNSSNIVLDFMMKKNKTLFLINSFGLRSETFISDQIAYYMDKAEVNIWCKYGKSENSITSFRFPDFKNRFLFVLRNIKFLKFSDLFKFFGRINNLSYYLNLELFYYIFFIRKFRLEADYDTIYAHFGMNGKLAEELMYFKVLRAKKLFTHFHGLDLLPTKYSPKYYHGLFTNASGIICGSKYAFQQLVTLKNKNQNTVIIPCGVNNQIFQEEFMTRKTPSSRLNMISVGRFIEWKGMIRFVELSTLLLSKGFTDFHIQLIGNGSEFERIKKLIEEKELQKYIELLGALPHEQVAEKISDADVFVYLGITDRDGRAETQGVVILEAQYSGLPVISTKVGGVHEYIEEGRTGFVFGEHDIAGIADKLIELSKDKELIRSLGKQAHVFINENLTQEILLEKNYNHVIKNQCSQ